MPRWDFKCPDPNCDYVVERSSHDLEQLPKDNDGQPIVLCPPHLHEEGVEMRMEKQWAPANFSIR